MNKELLLVATGVGIGALMFTDQGKKLVQATMGNNFLPALDGGEGSGGDKSDSSEKESKSDKKDEDDFFGKDRDKEKE